MADKEFYLRKLEQFYRKQEVIEEKIAYYKKKLYQAKLLSKKQSKKRYLK